MYKSFYKLSRNPFEISPDPSFLFPTRRHNEALAALYYGVRRHKGFVVLTGEVGTGKTLLVRCLLQLLKGSDVAYAYVFNSHLSSFEFLQYTSADLGLRTLGKSKAGLLLELGAFLVNRHQKRLTTVLVADEAHHLSAEVLEEIRLLTNLETTNGKLLQILLVGQPELDEKLDAVELRQLKQRIALRSHLEPLDMQETIGYIQRRLQLAGASYLMGEIFPQQTVAEVQRYSQGIPRLINTICENALITAFARQLGSIPPEIIQEVASDLRLNVVPTSKAEKIRNNENNELVHAVTTLLQFHHQLRGTRPREQEAPLIVTSGARKHEPII
jgi:general secretion pathway protein A